MADLITAVEYVEIGSVPLATPAFRCLNTVAELLQSADTAGKDTVIPGAHGARPNARWRRPTIRTLEIEIFGDRDRANTPYSNVRTGLAANVLVLQALVTTSVTATLHYSGGTKTATVLVEGLGLAPHSPTMMRATMRICIPAGQFA